MDATFFFKDIDFLPESLIATIGVYLCALTYTRVFGLKSFSKMTGVDFVNTIAIGSLIAMSATTGKPSLATGAVVIGGFFSLNYIISFFRFRSRKVQKAVDNKPLLLMYEGELLRENLRTSSVTEDELKSKLREANVLKLSQVKAVILETTGDVSVMHSDDNYPVEDYLLDGIER